MKEVLKKTIFDLAAEYPRITSVAIVPLGLTRYNTDPRLTRVTPEFCREVIDQVSAIQKELHASSEQTSRYWATRSICERDDAFRDDRITATIRRLKTASAWSDRSQTNLRNSCDGSNARIGPAASKESERSSPERSSRPCSKKMIDEVQREIRNEIGCRATREWLFRRRCFSCRSVDRQDLSARVNVSRVSLFAYRGRC